MAYDDIIIGSGLSGLAVAMGLNPKRRVLVLSEPEPLSVRYYDAKSNVPSGVHGLGGLGNFWHGVIPFSSAVGFASDCQEAFEVLFAQFYPDVSIADRYGSRWLFVPRRPIRPRQHWPRLQAEREGRLEIEALTATRFSRTGTGVTVEAGTQVFEASRLWICAGALDTPALLARSLGSPVGFAGTASDHVICYLGQVSRSIEMHVDVERSSQGYWFAALPASTSAALITAKPARFSYRKLDHGIEQRAAFGLPVGGVVSKVLRAGSLGLLSEAIFNKTGLFPDTELMSVYAQVPVARAYKLDLSSGALNIQLDTIRAASEAVRRSVDVPGMVRSRRPDLFIRGIHLHDTIDEGAMAAYDINTSTSSVRVMDASMIGRIGGEHHSFHMMAKAFDAARQI